MPRAVIVVAVLVCSRRAGAQMASDSGAAPSSRSIDLRASLASAPALPFQRIDLPAPRAGAAGN